jgi:hypothetical protein
LASSQPFIQLSRDKEDGRYGRNGLNGLNGLTGRICPSRPFRPFRPSFLPRLGCMKGLKRVPTLLHLHV